MNLVRSEKVTAAVVISGLRKRETYQPHILPQSGPGSRASFAGASCAIRLKARMSKRPASVLTLNQAKEANMGKFEIFVGNDGQYYFHLKAENGLIIAASQGYTTKQSAQNGIEAIQRVASAAPVADMTLEEVISQ